MSCLRHADVREASGSWLFAVRKSRLGSGGAATCARGERSVGTIQNQYLQIREIQHTWRTDRQPLNADTEDIADALELLCPVERRRTSRRIMGGMAVTKLLSQSSESLVRR